MRAHRMLAGTALACLCVSCRSEVTGQEGVRRALKEAYGPQATWTVAFMRDSRHLLIQTEGAYFGTLTDSLFDRRAREVARLALRHYPSAEALDSVTVAVGEFFGRGYGLGMFRVGRSLSIPAREGR